jgi:hypothetical protein
MRFRRISPSEGVSATSFRSASVEVSAAIAYLLSLPDGKVEGSRTMVRRASLKLGVISGHAVTISASAEWSRSGLALRVSQNGGWRQIASTKPRTSAGRQDHA